MKLLSQNLTDRTPTILEVSFYPHHMALPVLSRVSETYLSDSLSRGTQRQVVQSWSNRGPICEQLVAGPSSGACGTNEWWRDRHFGEAGDAATPKKVMIHRIGWWENLQETPIFDGKNPWVSCRFSLKPIHWMIHHVQWSCPMIWNS